MNTNLGEYHIPVHADIHELDVIFVEEKDEIVNELGSKGIGEIGLVSHASGDCQCYFSCNRKKNQPVSDSF